MRHRWRLPRHRRVLVRLRRLLRGRYRFSRSTEPAAGKFRSTRGTQDAKNQLGIVIGLSELLLADLEPGDARHRDVEEIRRAGLKLVAMLDEDHFFRDKERL
jgi:hypothetical protein